MGRKPKLVPKYESKGMWTPEETIIITSDTHLGNDRSNKELFRLFLEQILNGQLEDEKGHSLTCDNLVLCGNIFDLWTGDKKEIFKKNTDILKLFLKFQDSQTPTLDLVVGNHDYWLRNSQHPAFKFYEGIEVTRSDQLKLVFLHGDEFDYWQLRIMLDPLCIHTNKYVGKIMEGSGQILPFGTMGHNNDTANNDQKTLVLSKEEMALIEPLVPTPTSKESYPIELLMKDEYGQEEFSGEKAVMKKLLTALATSAQPAPHFTDQEKGLLSSCLGPEEEKFLPYYKHESPAATDLGTEHYAIKQGKIEKLTAQPLIDVELRAHEYAQKHNCLLVFGHTHHCVINPSNQSPITCVNAGDWQKSPYMVRNAFLVIQGMEIKLYAINEVNQRSIQLDRASLELDQFENERADRS
ncbi:MAG: hypothetical protein ACFFC7_17355 [Candidatus Hermodarchaeota archaeon]